MDPTIKCKKHRAENANISGSSFHNVNLSDCDLSNVRIVRGNTDGMTVDGIPLADLVEACPRAK